MTARNACAHASMADAPIFDGGVHLRCAAKSLMAEFVDDLKTSRKCVG
jgi:hypothetical protein